MDDKSLVSQLPAKVRVQLYIEGLASFVPLWAIFPFIVGLALIHECRVRFHEAVFAEAKLVEFAALAVATVLAPVFVKAMWEVRREYELECEAEREDEEGRGDWGPTARLRALVVALACACALVGPWSIQLGIFLDQARVEQAYAKDAEALRRVGSMRLDERMPAYAEIQSHGALAQAFHCELCVAAMAKQAPAGHADWPTLADAVSTAREENGWAIFGNMAVVVAFFGTLYWLAMSGGARRPMMRQFRHACRAARGNASKIASWMRSRNHGGSRPAASKALAAALGAPSWLVFSMGMPIVAAHAWLHWFGGVFFLAPAASAGVGYVFLGGACVAGAAAFSTLFVAKSALSGRCRALASLALVAGCGWALSSPEFSPGRMLTPKEVDAAYARDVAALRVAALPAEPASASPGAKERWRAQPGVAVLVECEDRRCLPEKILNGKGGRMAWMPLAAWKREAKEINGGRTLWTGLGIVSLFCLAQALLGPLAWLGRVLSGAMRSAWEAVGRLWAGEAKLGLSRASSTPRWMATSLRAAGNSAKRKVEERALSTPRVRAEYERRALEAAAGQAKIEGSGASRL